MTTEKPEPIPLHRRDVYLKIILPFALGIVLIVVLVIIAALEGEPVTSGISSTLLTVIVLCPAVICLVPIYLLLVVAVVGMNHVHDGVIPPMRRLGGLTLMVRDRTYSVSDRVARTTINVSARFAPLDRLIFRAFDRPSPAKQEESDE